MTEGPSLPPPRYSHTLHVEAPQPKPFAFLLGVALLAFAVPAGLVFAFLRFVADTPPSAGPELATAQEPPKVAEAPPPAPMAAVFEIDAGSDAAAPVDSSSLAVAPELDAGDAGAAVAAIDAAPAPAPTAAVAAPAPPTPVTWEMGMGILHSCRDASGKYLDGYKECGTAGELDHYLAKVIAQDLVACDKDVPTAAVTMRANVDFGSNTGTLDVVDARLMQLTSPWSACLAQKFVLEGLAKIRHTHPKYTLTYRVIPHIVSEPAAR